MLTNPRGTPKTAELSDSFPHAFAEGFNEGFIEAVAGRRSWRIPCDALGPDQRMLWTMQAFIGTSGFSYPEWKGSFYPSKLPSARMLEHYAAHLPSVELNNTFYRLPKAALLEGWRQQVPEGFRFAVKASRRITHFQRLKGCADLLDYLYTSLRGLGPTLGPVLYQLPPTVQADAGLLREFLAQLPAGGRAAFEFRHASWFSDEILGALDEAGAALCGGNLDELDKNPPLVRTAPFAYLRLRKTEYGAGEVEAWAVKLQALGVSEVFAYFKHEVLGPQLAAQLRKILNG